MTNFFNFNLSCLQKWKLVNVFWIGVLIFCAILCFQLYLYIFLDMGFYNRARMKGNIVIWWTPFTGLHTVVKDCGEYQCTFTSNRTFKNHPDVKAFLFYGSRFDKTDLPRPRSALLWGILHEESPRNTPILSHEPVLSLFNISSTFSRHSSVPLTLQYLTSIDDLTSRSHYVPVKDKNIQLSKLAPVIYIQSDCITPNNRDSYVSELMKYIRVDSYGACLNNRKLPKRLQDPMKNILSSEMLAFISQYKFAVAFENAICDDYITEKLWRPLISGVVPIYIGSPTIKDWVPNENSVIYALDYKTPEELADYLKTLNANDSAYENYLAHKISSVVENELLLETMKQRHWSLDEQYDTSNYVEDFECRVCQQSYSNQTTSVNINHYNCEKPVSVLSNKHNYSNWWHADWEVAKCEARILRQFIDSNLVYTERTLNEETVRRMKSGTCGVT